MRNVPQIIAEAAADRKCQKLCPIETEASAARTAFGSINNDGVRPSPSERCFCTSDISQLDRHRWHDQPPSRLRRLVPDFRAIKQDRKSEASDLRVSSPAMTWRGQSVTPERPLSRNVGCKSNGIHFSIL